MPEGLLIDFIFLLRPSSLIRSSMRIMECTLKIKSD